MLTEIREAHEAGRPAGRSVRDQSATAGWPFVIGIMIINMGLSENVGLIFPMK